MVDNFNGSTAVTIPHNVSTSRETYTSWLHINSCMSKAENYKLLAQDAKKWAAKKVNGSERSY